MGRVAEAQRKLLEVSIQVRSLVKRRTADIALALSQQMMGAESMGIITVQLEFTDEKVCKPFLCGTCPHIVFTNTVRLSLTSPPERRQPRLASLSC
jgi:hypothetical protein